QLDVRLGDAAEPEVRREGQPDALLPQGEKLPEPFVLHPEHFVDDEDVLHAARVPADQVLDLGDGARRGPLPDVAFRPAEMIDERRIRTERAAERAPASEHHAEIRTV